MKANIKRFLIVFIICLLLIPTALVIAGEINIKSMAQLEVNEHIPKRLLVTPKKINVPKGVSEEAFQSLLEVSVVYKGSKAPQVITQYETNYEDIKEQLGLHTVLITYTENGCTIEAKICIKIIDASTEVPEQQFPYISGYGDKTFRAGQPVTREELATMIARLLTDDDVPEEVNTISDLIPERYSTNSINYVTKLGIMSIYLDGTFKTKGLVTWTEFNDIIKKIEPYVSEKKNIQTKTTGDVTRGETVVVFNELFDRRCTGIEVQNPYTDLKSDDAAYEAILCASVIREK